MAACPRSRAHQAREVLAATLLPAAVSASACAEMIVPASISQDDARNFSDVVVARIEQVTVMGSGGRYTPRFGFSAVVKETFKGSTAGGQFIVGWTTQRWHSCPIMFRAGETRVLFLTAVQGGFLVGWDDERNATVESSIGRSYVQQLRLWPR